MTDTVTITEKNFHAEIMESSVPVVIDFWAPWCGPCKAIGPILEELATEYKGRMKVAKVNVDEVPVLAGAFKVKGIPTLATISGGEVVDMQVGFGGRGALVDHFKKFAT